MDAARIRNLLQQVRDGALTPDAAMSALKWAPFEDLGYARIDTHRQLRTGVPEVVFCPGKTPGQVVEIGVRPEDLVLAAPGAKHTVSLSREFVEELGATRLIHGLAGGKSAMVMSLPAAAAGVGSDTLTIEAPAAAVHLFDTTTGVSLRV